MLQGYNNDGGISSTTNTTTTSLNTSKSLISQREDLAGSRGQQRPTVD